MTVNHDPNGVVSLHANGACSNKLVTTFQETEFVTSQDSVDSSFEQNLSNNLSRQNKSQICL